MNTFTVSSSPHTHSGASITRIMADVLIALVPALAAAIYFFGLDALRLVVLCTGTALIAEFLCRKLMKRDNTLPDLSAAVTGLLLAFNLPPGLPSWMAVAGTLFAIVIAKQLFGGLGYNPFNPALAGRAFLLISCTGAMTTWSACRWRPLYVNFGNLPDFMVNDGVTTATPLGVAKASLKLGESLPFNFNAAMMRDFFLGNINGCIGEVSALALLIGAAYLLIRRVITWHVPVAYIGTVILYAAALKFLMPATAWPVTFHLLSGGVILGAFFMATDMVTSPVTRSGQLIFGAGCGLLTMVIRTVPSGAYPEGTSFAILIMNSLTPLINRATKTKPFGRRLKAKG